MKCVTPKFKKLPRRLNQNSGMILIIVLWTLMILSMLAVGLGRKMSIELALTKHAVGKVKAKYLARAGVVFAKGRIQEDSDDKVSSKTDTLYYCGIRRDSEISLEDIFKNKVSDDGSFDIQWRDLGFQDEERRININTLVFQNVKVLSSLIILSGFDEETAQIIAYSVIDWKDKDSVVNKNSYGAEDDYYMSSKGYHCKNLAFDSVAELMLVRGMTKEIYAEIKDNITIFPKAGGFKVNFDTASSLVLKSLGMSISGMRTNTESQDVDAMVEKILEYRNGEDGEALTEDDRMVEHNKIPLNAKERVLFLTMNPWRTKKSNYFRVTSTGIDQVRNITSTIEAVIERDNLAIVFWKQN